MEIINDNGINMFLMTHIFLNREKLEFLWMSI